MKKLASVLTVVVITVIAGIVVAGAIIPRVIGGVPLTVLTGSMEPAISAGDLIVTMPVDDPQNIQVGDIVTFQPVSDDPALITHRVIDKQVSTAGLTFITQGDANGGPDDPLVAEQIMGTHLYTVPYVGFVAQAVPGAATQWVLPAAGFLLIGYAAYTLTLGQRRQTKQAALDQKSESKRDSSEQHSSEQQSVKS